MCCFAVESCRLATTEQKGFNLKTARIGLCLPSGVLLILSFMGCGVASQPPAASISPTANPLVAQYNITNFHSGLTAWVEFGPTTSYGRQTSMVTTTKTTIGGQPAGVLVAGMKPQTTYHMRAHVEWAQGSWVDQDRTFTTGAIPSEYQLPQITVTLPSSSAGAAPAPGIELLSMTSATNTKMLSGVATDLQGNVIWYCPGLAFPQKLQPNGHFVINQNYDLEEVDLACNQVRAITLAQLNTALNAKGYSYNLLYFSHDFLVLPNGHWVALVQVTQNFSDLPGYPGTTGVLGDIVVDIDPNGAVDWLWSTYDHLDVNRHLQGLPDWTHSNALVYTADGNILLSMRNQSWIIKIDYADGAGTGNILWTLGDGGDFTVLGGDPTQWFYGQHDPGVVTTDGSQTVLNVFDDGNLRVDSDGVQCGTSSTAPACYSRGAQFLLDESTNLATPSWSFSPGLYSFWGGSIGTLSNGDVELALSEPFVSNPTTSQIMEVSGTDTPANCLANECQR